MKKLLLVLLFVPLVSFGQNNNVNITAGESNAGIMSRMINEAMKDVGNFYIGDGLYNSDGSIYTTDEDKSMGKEAAKKELMELKEYLDMGIITKQEFDKKAESLKKILLGN